MTDTVQISAQAVNDLRARTGVGLMDCKRALVEAQGNVEKAIDLLRASGLASAAKKADRNAKDGLVMTALSADQTQGAMVMLSCETDFVAKTDDFKAFLKSLTEVALKNKVNGAEAMQNQQVNGQNVKDAVSALIAKLGENMQVKGAVHYAGSYVEQYIHIGGKVGVLLNLKTGNAATAQKAEFKALAKDICMHIAASSPAGVRREEIPADVVAKEKEIATEQAKGKPAAAMEKIVSGKLEKFYAQNCLLEQPFVKNPDTTIRALVDTTAKALGDTVTVEAFTRLQVGA